MQFSSATLSSLGLLFVIVALAVFLLRKKTSKLRYLMSRLPQGPPPLPVVGNALDLLGGGLDHVLQVLMVDWPNKYGEIFCSYIGPNWNVNISSPELMESVLSSNKVLDKGPDYDFLLPWLGEGLLLSSGNKWKLRRRLLTPAFHFKILNDFIHIFNKQSQILCEIFHERCAQSNESGVEFDIFPYMVNCTLDIICEAAMGVEINAQTQESEFVKAIHRADQIVIERMSQPWLANETLFSITPTGRQNKQLLRVIHRFSEQIIEKRRKQLKKTKYENETKRCQALLDLLLNTLDENQVGLSNQDIREEIDTFMFAGHDTTTSAISFFLYCMAKNPQYQERVFDELQDVFGHGDNNLLRNCTQQDLPNLQFLECCIKEAMRLYSPVPHIERRVDNDIQIGEHLIPAGANVSLLIYSMHRNPRLYPDPLVYNPERFFPDECATRHPYSFIPFSAGSRNCIGQRFAMIEMKVLLSWLLRRFKFSVSPLHAAPVPSFQVVLKPMQGIHLVITPL